MSAGDFSSSTSGVTSGVAGIAAASSIFFSSSMVGAGVSETGASSVAGASSAGAAGASSVIGASSTALASMSLFSSSFPYTRLVASAAF